MVENTQNSVLVFPGQGAQFSGMGKDLYETCDAAKAVFDTLEAIRPGLIQTCFAGTKEELSLTLNAQPCIFAVSMAFAAHVKAQGHAPQATAGFSVGEVAALTYAGVMTLEDGFNAILKRAEFMHACTLANPGAMSAVLRLETAKVEELAAQHGVYPVNYNCPGQIVVSGGTEPMAAFNASVAQAGGRAMPLAVSGAFHSPYMAEASKNFRAYLQGVTFSTPTIPVYANVTAKPYEATTDTDKLKDIFAIQIQNPVRWEQTVRNLKADGAIAFIEAPPGKVLTGLISKIV